MTRTAEDIIKEAELKVQQNKVDSLEKKASEVAEEMITQRTNTQIEKLASESPLIKLAMESEGDPFATKTFKVDSCIEKLAGPAGTAVSGFLAKMMANNGARNIMVGAGIGAGGGMLANKDDRMGGAIKGALLGGAAGAGVSAYKAIGSNAGLLGNSGKAPFTQVAARTRSFAPEATKTNALLGKVNAHLGQSGERASKMVGNRYDVLSTQLNTTRNALNAGLKPEAGQAIKGLRSDILAHANKNIGSDLGALAQKRDIEKTLKGSVLNRMGFRTKAGDLARTEEALAKLKGGAIHENYSAGVHKRYVDKVHGVGTGAVSKFNAGETQALADKFKNPAAITDSGLDSSIRSAANQHAKPGMVTQRTFGNNPTGSAVAPKGALSGVSGVGNTPGNVTLGNQAAAKNVVAKQVPKPILPKPSSFTFQG